MEADWKMPKVRSDVYHMDVSGLRNAHDIVSEVESEWLLCEHFQWLAAMELQEVESRLGEEDLAPGARGRLETLKNILQDEDDGWREWVLFEGDAASERFRQEIARWLEEPLDWDEREFWPRGWEGQAGPLDFFYVMDDKLRDSLGIVIIEGDQPGSSYFAAELRNDLADANATADALGLPFRFRPETCRL